MKMDFMKSNKVASQKSHYLSWAFWKSKGTINPEQAQYKLQTGDFDVKNKLDMRQLAMSVCSNSEASLNFIRNEEIKEKAIRILNAPAFKFAVKLGKKHPLIAGILEICRHCLPAAIQF